PQFSCLSSFFLQIESRMFRPQLFTPYFPTARTSAQGRQTDGDHRSSRRCPPVGLGPVRILLPKRHALETSSRVDHERDRARPLRRENLRLWTVHLPQFVRVVLPAVADDDPLRRRPFR